MSGLHKRGDRRFAIAYFTLACCLAVFILPSSLRPPSNASPTSPELSPDAPPDPNQESIVSALSRATSATAGAGTAAGTSAGDGPGLGGGPGAPAPPPPQLAPPRACPRGFGNPPRQVESPYSPPCAAPFAGDNGGATAVGVTRDEIRVSVQGVAYRGHAHGCATNGDIDQMNPANMDMTTRTFWVWERYFNANFQLYGRQLRFFCAEPESASDAAMTASGQLAASYGVFGAAATNVRSCQEMARLQRTAMCDFPPTEVASASPSRIWAMQWLDGDALARLVSNYICSRLAGKLAEHAGDPQIQQQARKIGIVYFDSRGYEHDGRAMERELKACGSTPVAIAASTDSTDSAQRNATAIALLRREGVTTIIPMMDVVETAALTGAADGQGYFPEWFVTDWGYNTLNAVAQLFSPSQWRHAFGVGAAEMPRLDGDDVCIRAYHSVDPTTNPNPIICRYQWNNFVTFVSGIQLAGPRLTPDAWAAGWYKLGLRFPAKPAWAIGGGFAPGQHSYANDMLELWWDPTASDPQGGNNNVVGAYRYPNAGRRYRFGGFPAATRLFVDGDTYTTEPVD
jgi:hypothetical protein